MPITWLRRFLLVDCNITCCILCPSLPDPGPWFQPRPSDCFHFLDGDPRSIILYGWRILPFAGAGIRNRTTGPSPGLSQHNENQTLYARIMMRWHGLEMQIYFLCTLIEIFRNSWMHVFGTRVECQLPNVGLVEPQKWSFLTAAAAWEKFHQRPQLLRCRFKNSMVRLGFYKPCIGRFSTMEKYSPFSPESTRELL
jgi:hypothetical protein